MTTTIQVQTDHYTDENSHPVKFLIDNIKRLELFDSQIPDELDVLSIRNEFDCVFFDGLEGWQLTMPQTLCVFIGRCVLHKEDDLRSWWEFKGTIIPATIPGWGEISHG